jgi:hypothetical protein
MTLGIMQPYFLPYIGYWQLLAAVDRFVVYDNIKYTKQGWINRNRFLRHGTDAFFTLPLKKASDFLDIRDRVIADNFHPRSVLNPLGEAYRHAPFFEDVFPVVDAIVSNAARNLFDYVYDTIHGIASYLDIGTPLIVSSTIPIDHGLKADQKVLAICGAFGATTYVNSIGGRELYSVDAFAARGVELKFLQPRPLVYRQFTEPFVPNLSLVDVMMFNSRDAVKAMLREYDLV